MKNSIFISRLFRFIFIGLSVVCFSCENTTDTTSDAKNPGNKTVTEDVKSYWYSGLAEISSYELTQQRYGEERQGKAVLIYVTEDFDHEKLVKADEKKDGKFPVLKLNSTKEFTTGIYPYFIMQSSFLPMEENNQVSKITASIQEWCGQSFMMLEQREKMDIQINSYFQKIANKHISVSKASTENGLWNQLRLFPTQIDTSVTSMLPSFEYLRLHNKEAKAYEVKISQNLQDGILVTLVDYPSLNRKLELFQEAVQPYSITKWKESITHNDSTFVTKAIKISQIRVDYWNKNKEQHNFLRDSLKL